MTMSTCCYRGMYGSLQEGCSYDKTFIHLLVMKFCRSGSDLSRDCLRTVKAERSVCLLQLPDDLLRVVRSASNGCRDSPSAAQQAPSDLAYHSSACRPQPSASCSVSPRVGPSRRALPAAFSVCSCIYLQPYGSSQGIQLAQTPVLRTRSRVFVLLVFVASSVTGIQNRTAGCRSALSSIADRSRWRR